MYGKREMRYTQAARRYNSEAKPNFPAAAVSSPWRVRASPAEKKASVEASPYPWLILCFLHVKVFSLSSSANQLTLISCSKIGSKSSYFPSWNG
jgi:hypothetical protein